MDDEEGGESGACIKGILGGRHLSEVQAGPQGLDGRTA